MADLKDLQDAVTMTGISNDQDQDQGSGSFGDFLGSMAWDGDPVSEEAWILYVAEAGEETRGGRRYHHIRTMTSIPGVDFERAI